MPADCVTLWIGNSLGPLERACLRSVDRCGHRITLYCYSEPEGVPDGVELRDAGDILPESEIVRHCNGSVAPFSDWFRYELMKRGLGTWIDTDLYLLGQLDEGRPYLFGEERPGVINNAVLRLPADSPLLDELLLPFAGNRAPWLSVRHRAMLRLRKLFGGGIDVGALPWGTTGPAALTAAAGKFKLSSHALPPAVFYPARWEQAAWILDPAIKLEDMVTRDTVGVHLWNECIRQVKNEPAPKGSFLARLQREGA